MLPALLSLPWGLWQRHRLGFVSILGYLLVAVVVWAPPGPRGGAGPLRRGEHAAHRRFVLSRRRLRPGFRGRRGRSRVVLPVRSVPPSCCHGSAGQLSNLLRGGGNGPAVAGRRLV